MNVLVTGGAGYIGSHTAKALRAASHEPVTFDNLSEGHRCLVRWGPLVVGDLADRDSLERVLVDHSIQAVMHFAAHAYVGESVVHPRKYFRNNVVNTLNLLEAMVDCNVKHIVFSSSCATYGLPDVLPLGEKHPQRPISPYGESKLMVEKALRWFGSAYDIRWAALRYFNAAGADPSGETGEMHAPETHLIPTAIRAALGMGPPLDVYGTDHPTPDGTARRDYIHVTDLARAHVLALEHVMNRDQNLVVNLGTGQSHSVYEVVRSVERVTGRSVPVRPVGRRDGDPPVLVANPSLACSMLEWTPQYMDLDSIVETAWRWQVTFDANGRERR